ncbi:MAG: bifunctional proline dehydrogenase/L-glutamate gamma-semialdehyde dehydrogenase [Simkania sp.]|nr:bifunctional proline dehydrogenase/L-glutamate gamma-semialdehyde dehydrogenase [Simkania sp.]MCP5490643.1 bifunctional proline dehydrogenase/L-glutamate gamma-semialdehyde dehydrogenase [Chlamydiales bacterium]
MHEASESKHLKAAREMLSAAYHTPLTLKERQEKAIELASHILLESNQIITKDDQKKHEELSRMMRDPVGKVFTTAMTDQCFRSHDYKRIANQMIYLLNLYGIPKFLGSFKRLQLYLFKLLGDKFANILVPMAMRQLRKETSKVIIPGEKGPLAKHIKKRKAQGIRLNLNHLGEAILGEEEAKKRLEVYLRDLKNPYIDYVSIKISTIYSQLNLLSYENTLDNLAARLRELYRAAIENKTQLKDGCTSHKFVNLDMEEYRDLHLTKDLFIKVLSEPEFHSLSAGIVLQAYLPDSHDIQKELTHWAMDRVRNGGAPIKIRIVKGANMAMEQVEASLRDWEQAPYEHKIQTDANYKSMILYACEPEHSKAVHIGVASHNLFDIAFAMLLRLENRVEQEVTFEMLEGMADHTRQVVQALTNDILLYCAVATKEDFQSAIAYLIRRLDENTGIENYLAHSFGLTPEAKEWSIQCSLFRDACQMIPTIYQTPRRTQNRFDPPSHLDIKALFENESDTDFSLAENRKWGKAILETWKNKQIDPIPLVIEGKEISHSDPEGKGYDPSTPSRPLYTYSMASWEEVDQALKCAKNYEKTWGKTSVEERCKLLSKVAQRLRETRADLIGAMVADGGKLIMEADVEHSETIDFAEYYLRSMQHLNGLSDIQWSPKGTILVTPPWNFPTSIPGGGICTALVTGNCVLFKPAPEAVLAGWELVKAFWDAGIPKEALQFINCADDPVGSQLIKDTRVNSVILTGATSTAYLFAKMRPGIDLSAETGGKNALIISSLSDRDLAIKDLVQSAFGHNGQKCSAASLAILEKEVYDDPHFRKQLRDAAASLKVGSAWDLSSKITPLIREPGDDLKKGLTTLEEGEFWLLEPKQDSSNPNLWSPGIKFGVHKGSYTQQTEFFGPVLGVMRAENIDHAIHLANSTPYGLTSGIHSLDKREIKKWQNLIIAGNCYINRTITGAIVRRQPFGGCKNSSYGHGSKAGGPNYLTQFMHATQKGIPKEKFPVGEWVNNLTRFLEKFDLSAEELGMWYASVSSYAFFWQQFKRDKDSSKIVGQDNFFRYLPQKKLIFRIGPNTKPMDYLRIFAAALTCETRLEVSWEKSRDAKVRQANWEALLPIFNIVEEDQATFIKRMCSCHFKRIRMLEEPSAEMKQAAAASATYIDHTPVLANGRIELLHYLREMSLSVDYHRYGNLGLREGELRKPIL